MARAARRATDGLGKAGPFLMRGAAGRGLGVILAQGAGAGDPWSEDEVGLSRGMAPGRLDLGIRHADHRAAGI